jgi:hypothetical protein
MTLRARQEGVIRESECAAEAFWRTLAQGKRDAITVLDAGRIAGRQGVYGYNWPATFQGRSSATRLTG